MRGPFYLEQISLELARCNRPTEMIAARLLY